MVQHFIGIDHVQLAAPAGSEDEARHFFGNILGMEEVPKPEELRKRGGVWFQCGAQQLHIGIETPFSAAKKAHPAFLARNLDSLQQRLENHAIAFKTDDLVPRVKRIFLDDPFGNRIEIMEIEE